MRLPSPLLLLFLSITAANANALPNPFSLRRQAQAATGSTSNKHDSPPPLTLGASTDRPARVVLPSNYYDDDGDEAAGKKRKRYPALVVLHGWGSSGNYHDFFLGISERRDEFGGFVTILPNGTMDPKRGGRFWDARACCNHDRLPVDDDAYLSGIVEEAKQRYRIDASQIYAVGHSNGGLMSQVMACQHSDLFNGFAAVAPGPIPAMCWETKAKKILMVGGTDDKWTPPCFIADNAKRWAEYLECPYEKPAIEGELRNYDCDEGPHLLHTDAEYDPYRDKNCDKTGPAKETVVTEWHGCGQAQDRKLATWMVGDATHNPAFNAQWSDDVIQWLLQE